MPPPFSPSAPEFERDVLGVIYAGRGDELPVSAFPVDGTFPTGTAKWEKRNLALEIPAWDSKICIQCGKCAMVCPHSVIRIKVYDSKELQGAPATFKSTETRDREWQGLKYTIQVAPEDCTGCGICVEVCPVKNKAETRLKAINMVPQPPLRVPERENWEFFLKIPEMDRRNIKVTNIRQQQIQEPLFEFSGACAGCGETPYLKLMSQLFGDRAIIANATGCSSIYGGNLPDYALDEECAGRGPAWSNSLFEDNAEFGLGFRLSIDKQTEFAQELVKRVAGTIGEELATAILTSPQKDEADIYEQRQRVDLLKEKLHGVDSAEAKSNCFCRRRPAGQEKHLDRRRRRLGLRHRLRRPRSCIGQRPQRQRAGARYRGLFQHRRSGVQIHASRGRGEIRRRRQTRPEERSGPHRHELRQHLCRQRRHGREGRAHAEGVSRSRSLQRAQPHHRVFALHRSRHQHDDGNVESESGRRFRTVAALSLQPGTGGAGRESTDP